MAFKIRWTRSAAQDFEKLALYIEERSGFIESQSVTIALQDAIDGLVVFPHRTQQVESKELRRHPCKGFFIIYQVLDDQESVEIIRILGQRQDLPKHI